MRRLTLGVLNMTRVWPASCIFPLPGDDIQGCYSRPQSHGSYKFECGSLSHLVPVAHLKVQAAPAA
jgi:hypothetical protein